MKNAYEKHKNSESVKYLRKHLSRVKVLSQPVRGDVLRKALDDLDLWGEQFGIIITKLLQANGLVFDAHHYYSLHDIEKQLRRFLGKENSRQISAVIKIGIQVQYFSY
ncbi:hypothetical protein NTE_02441 [Candidatus Nitrososphaera evergladensis SR1]|jgi:hypothetical protein|uniref:Uncharacterized protein n=1 Tax=Candidatus Nitrososphaera evergladensis SR1 TaxID=1459636 RepID=A0A075MSD4_9ARCH|nr:hypothetical protein [Candidatus Nitrososphaera evergladensis]AIF84491.1 hypothetical protein NTE_02441 [Candidatus Nitrososphaera evergladensis SR1]